MPGEDLVELKFRLYDGSDIGPFRYSAASTVAMLKERIVAEWPKDKKIAPKGANDIKLINAGKFLENNKTVGQCRAPFDDLPKSVITMHVVVQPSATKANTAEKKVDEPLRKNFCSCSVFISHQAIINKQSTAIHRLMGLNVRRQQSHQLARQVWLGAHLLRATFPVTLAWQMRYQSNPDIPNFCMDSLSALNFRLSNRDVTLCGK
ncbi:hypothetical protein V6N13_044208 [Hibiscus sabdariffa]